MDQNNIDPADIMDYTDAGDSADRVVWGKISNEIKIPKVSSLDLPEAEGIYAIHVTGDPEYWIDRLEKDYDRDSEEAKIISIKLIDGDCLIDDHQYAFDPETSDKSSAYILLTTRAVLKKGLDFDVR